MRPRRCAHLARTRPGCSGSSTAPTAPGASAQPVLLGERTSRSDCLSGEFFGVGREAASVPARTHRSGTGDLGPARRKIHRQSGTPAPPSPEANKAKAALTRCRGTSQDGSPLHRRPGTKGRLSPSGVPRRRFFFLIRSSKTKRRHECRDGVAIFTVPVRDARTKSAPWPDR